MSLETTEGKDGVADPDPGADPEAEESTEGSEDGGAEPLPLDVVFDILKNRRRRLVLKYAREGDGPFTLSDIAEYIAAEENDKPIRQLTSDERKRVYVGLYQCHLPRMDDAGVLDFDRNRGTVVMNESIGQLEAYLNADDDDERNWAAYYAGLTVAGVLLYGAAMLPFVPVPLWVATLLVLVGLGCCSLLQLTLGDRPVSALRLPDRLSALRR